MASDRGAPARLQYTADQIARLRNGAAVSLDAHVSAGHVTERLSRREVARRYRADRDSMARKVALSAAVLVVLAFFSLCFTGAMGQYYPYAEAYTFFTPAQVACALYEHLYDAVAQLTHAFDAHSRAQILAIAPAYWAVESRAGVVGITCIAAALTAIAGMLYQNVFKNPLAGPNMLGASNGVSLGMMVLVALYGGAATGMVGMRYLLCYGFGAAILVFIIVAGRKLSGAGKPFDIVTMLLIGSILGQLIGFVVMYMTLYVMSEEDYAVFYTLSQMLTVDTSALSWVTLGIAAAASVIPIYLLRFRMNALAYEEEEVRLFGIDYTRLRGIALVCGAVMILAAQVHTGSVGMVAVIVPFLARGWFGCEFSKQFTGNVCISATLLLAVRDLTDAIPFVGDGLAIGSVMSVAALPLFILVATRYMRGWGE